MTNLTALVWDILLGECGWRQRRKIPAPACAGVTFLRGNDGLRPAQYRQDLLNVVGRINAEGSPLPR